MTENIELNNEAQADAELIATLTEMQDAEQAEAAEGVFVNDDGETTQIN